MDTHRFPRVLLAFGLMGLASLSLVACSNESRYCDDTGCYFCDGLGCRLVNPAARPSCDCSYQCAMGSACTSLGCTVTCMPGASTGCPDGTVCRALPTATFGYCLGPQETTPTANSCICSTSADCTGDLVCIDGECRNGCHYDPATQTSDCPSGQSCVDGACRTNPTQVGCDATHPCATGSSCIAGACVPDTQTCRFNTECGAGRICVNQQCTDACGATNPCQGSATCGADGYCHEIIPPVTGCSTSDDCDAGETCVDGRCFAGCTVDSDCPEGDYCDAGICRLDTRVDPGCGTPGRMCAAGSVCRNGACRSPCSTDAECPLHDVQTNFCVENVCARTNEATSNCSSATDCTGGEICVDGNCR